MATTVFYLKDDLSKRFGLAPSTIDDYVALGLLQPVRRSGDALLFTSRAIVTIEIIQKGKYFGFTLYEIKRLIDASNEVSPFANAEGGDKI